jgi:Peptidase M50B-like
MFLALELARSHLQHAPRTLAPLPTLAVVLIGLAALVIVLWKEVWVIAGHLSVVAHEGAHALVGWGAGYRVKSVKLSLDDRGLAGGATMLPGLHKGPGRIITGFVGYVGPSGFGLGAAKLIAMDHIQAVLWLMVAGLAGLLLFTRNVRGFVSVAGAGGLVLLVLWRGPTGLQTVTSYGITWFLLVSGIRGVLEDGPKASDAAVLKQWTNVPRLLWFAVWLAGTLWALAAGGHMLV